jgi:hypothetical protein
MSTPSNSAYGSGAAKTKAHWLAVKNAMHFSSSLARSPTRKSSSAMSIYRYQFKAALAAILSIVLIGVRPTPRVRQNFASPPLARAPCGAGGGVAEPQP